MQVNQLSGYGQGTVTLGTVKASGNVLVSATGAPAGTVTVANGTAANGNFTVMATGAASASGVALGDGTTTGNFTVTSSTGLATATGTSVGGVMTAGTLSASSIGGDALATGTAGKAITAMSQSGNATATGTAGTAIMANAALAASATGGAGTDISATGGAATASGTAGGFIAAQAGGTASASGMAGSHISAISQAGDASASGTAKTDYILAQGVTSAMITTANAGTYVNANASNGAATVNGAITAGTDYVVSGTSVLLGGASPVLQTAGGKVTIAATSGDVTQGAGTLTLQADKSAAGNTLAVTAGSAAGATTGSIALGNTDFIGGATGAVMLSAGTAPAQAGSVQDVAFKTIAGGSVAVTAGRNIAGQTIVSSAGPIAVTAANSVALAGLSASGATGTINVNATGASGTIAVSGKTTTLGTGDITFASTGTTQLNSVNSGGKIGVKASSMTIADTVQSTGDTTLTATDLVAGSVKLNSTVSAANVTVSSPAVTFGDTVKATNITIIDSSTAAGSKMDLGGGFISATDISTKLLATQTLTFDATAAGAGGIINVGAFSPNGSVKMLNIFGLGSIFVNGKIAGQSLAALQIGGTSPSAPADNTGLAKLVSIQTALDGSGGAIDIGTAALTLERADDRRGRDDQDLAMRSAWTQGSSLTPSQAATAAAAMVNNPNSALYYSVDGGTNPYQTKAATYITAGTLTVNYANFALFQNTGIPGLNSGVALSSAKSGALTLTGIGSAPAGPFEVFGTINGVSGVSTALLGSSILSKNVSPGTARVNGCIIGSSASCLNPGVLDAVLNIVDPERVSILYANTDFQISFDSLIGTNNDVLFNDFDILGVGDLVGPLPDSTPPICGADKRTNCAQTTGDAHQ